MKSLRLVLAVSLASIQTCCCISKDAAVPLLSPPQVQTESILISPEDLVAATLPWQGMGSPWKAPKAWGQRHSKYQRSTAPVHNPWDVGVDEFITSGGSHSSGSAISPHPPPPVFDDGDLKRLPSQASLEQHNYKILQLEPMPISGPAMVAHGYKPSGFYTNPNAPLAAGSSTALLQIRSRLRGRVRVHEDPPPNWLLNAPTVLPPSQPGELGSAVPGKAVPGKDTNRDLMLPPKYQPSTSAERNFMTNKRRSWDSFDAQAMSKVAPTVGTSSWLVRPVFDFQSKKADPLNKLLYKAQTQRDSPPPAYEQVPMWPGTPPHALFD